MVTGVVDDLLKECNYIIVNDAIDNDVRRRNIKLTPNMTPLFSNLKPMLHSKIFEVNYALRVNYHLKMSDDKLSIIAYMTNPKSEFIDTISDLVRQQSKPLLKINLNIKNSLLYLNNIQVNLKNIQKDEWSLFTYIDSIVWVALLPFTPWIHPNRVMTVTEALYSLYVLSYYSKLFGKYKTMHIDFNNTSKLKDCVLRNINVNPDFSEFKDKYKSAFRTPTGLGVSFNYEDPLLGELINIARKFGFRKQLNTTIMYGIKNKIHYKYPIITLSLYNDYNYGVMIRSFYEGKELLVPKSVVEEVIEYYSST